MPVNPSHYPPGWRAFSAQIRFARAHGRCECTGECGMHSPNPNPRRCIERHGQKALWARGTIKLTVAHLCNCNPICLHPAHVKAMCQRCHLRVDRFLHARHRLERQRQRHALSWHPRTLRLTTLARAVQLRPANLNPAPMRSGVSS
jgi:hypothetical protein